MSGLDDPNYTPKTAQARARMEGYQAAAAGRGWDADPYASDNPLGYYRCWNSGFAEWQRTHPMPAVSTCWANVCIQSKARS